MPLSHLHSEGTKATFRLLLLSLVTLLFGLAFAALASEVFEGDTRALDASIAVIANALRVNYPWLVDVMRDLSGLGSTVTLAIAVGITVAYLLLIGLRFVGCAVAASSLSGIAAVSLLKGCLDALGRTRFPRSPQQLA
jgi:hypothetical protein